MANFVINQTASEIQQILNKAESPDTTPTSNSQNLVESGGVKTYVDSQVSAGASITTASFAPSALEDSTDGLTATDDAVPTSKAVRNYVDSGVPDSATVITTNARTGNPSSGNLFYRNLTETTDPNSIISINSSNEIQFASTGTYFIKAGISFSDNDGSGGDYYVVSLVSTNSSSPTTISSGGQPLTLPRYGDNSSAVKSYIFSYAVTNTTNNRLSISVTPISNANRSSWEGAAAIEITKIS
jgi:hypothetical protein